jgi:hypothetical protein
MKKIIFTLSFVFATMMVAKAQTATPVVSTSLAEMTFETETHDFGTIDYSGNGTYEFKFKIRKIYNFIL